MILTSCNYGTGTTEDYDEERHLLQECLDIRDTLLQQKSASKIKAADEEKKNGDLMRKAAMEGILSPQARDEDGPVHKRQRRSPRDDKGSLLEVLTSSCEGMDCIFSCAVLF